jgi:hypothetical protein
MRRRLVDDAAVYTSDLDEAEADWMRRRVRGDDGEQLARAFGLHLERRSEGAAFVVPDDAFRYDRELGPMPFPSAGTVPHAALLLCEYARTAGTAAADGVRPGWLAVTETAALDHLTSLAQQYVAGRGGWKADFVEKPGILLEQVRALLTGLDLVRVETTDGGATWWFSPVTARWAPAATTSVRKTRNGAAPGEQQELTLTGPHDELPQEMT